MSQQTEQTAGTAGGIGLGGGFALLFTYLKLTGHVDWSWWAVTAPLWGPFVLVLVMLAGVVLIGGLKLFFDDA